jgi:hypothetical protein
LEAGCTLLARGCFSVAIDIPTLPAYDPPS